MTYIVMFPAGDFMSGPDGVAVGYPTKDEAQRTVDLFGGTVVPVRLLEVK